MIRNMLPAPGFEQAIQNITDLGTEREVMDAYHPEATYESKDSYEAGGCK